MSSSLRSLQQVAPPPAVPLETGTPADWSRAEAEIGLPLPADYRELLQAYGSGCFRRFLWPLNPVGGDETLRMAKQAPRLLRKLADEQHRNPTAIPFPLHPAPGGLLPWAWTERGDTLGWLTDGDPARWPVVVAYGSGGTAERFDRTATAFLFSWLSGLIAPRLAPTTPDDGADGPFLSIEELRRGR